MQAISLENKIDGVGLQFNFPGADPLRVIGEGCERAWCRVNTGSVLIWMSTPV